MILQSLLNKKNIYIHDAGWSSYVLHRLEFKNNQILFKLAIDLKIHYNEITAFHSKINSALTEKGT